MSNPDVQLMFDGMQYGGWKSMNIGLGMDQCANSFELATSELWPDQKTPVPINQDEACQVTIDGDTVVTGWVDEVAPEYAAADHQVSVKGRDVTADLVDCNVEAAKMWLNASFDKIARDLCAPFKSVKVKLQSGVSVGKALIAFEANLGDKVFEVLDKGAQQCGVLLFSDGLGNLVIGRAGTQKYKDPLVLGVNLKSGRASSDYTNRFSSYRFVAQPALDDNIPPSIAVNTSGSATDSNVKRHRPWVAFSGNYSDGAALTQRARWRANVQAARSCKAMLVVQGWRNRDELWRPNRLVEIHDPFLKLDGDYLISAVRLKLDGKEGFRTELEVTLKAAYSTLAVPAKDDISVLG